MNKQGRPKKIMAIQVDLNKELMDWFTMWCKRNEETRSGHLRRYILKLRKQDTAEQQTNAIKLEKGE